MRKFYTSIIRDIAGSDPKKLLDVGGGDGRVISLLSKRLKKTVFYYVDPSPQMVELAMKRLHSKDGIPASNIAAGSSRKVPFKFKFDMIISTISFHHWNSKQESLKYLLGRLNAGGELRIYEFCLDRLKGVKRGAKAHAMSTSEAKNYSFKGFRRDIRIINGDVIVLSFKKTARNN